MVGTSPGRHGSGLTERNAERHSDAPEEGDEVGGDEFEEPEEKPEENNDQFQDYDHNRELLLERGLIRIISALTTSAGPIGLANTDPEPEGAADWLATTT